MDKLATQVFAPVGGMNQDDSIINPTPNMAGRNAFALGDYKYAANARIGSSRSDNFNDVENIKGTTEVTAYYVRSGSAWVSGTRPVGTEKVIGKYENKESQLLYYAVYNSAGNHCLRFYDPYQNRVYELLKWSGLSFLSTYFVSMSMIDNWLAITDRNNSPRLMDVDTISDLYNTLTSNFREYHISFHKWAPVMPPVIRAYYDGVTANNLNFVGKAYQFSYRYIYKGRLKSRWSPISSCAQQFESVITSGVRVTAIEIYIPGFTLDAPGSVTSYNYFNNDNIKFYSAVEFIEIAFRESSLDVWRLFTRWTVQTSGNITPPWRYTGKSDSTPIPADDFFQLFDTVPFQAGCVESIDNRFVFADCLDEKDVAPALEVTDVGVAKFDSNSTLIQWWNAGSDDAASNAIFFPTCSPTDANEVGLRNLISDTTFKGRGLYKFGIQWLHENGWRSAVYTDEDFIIEIPAETGIIDKFYAIEFKLPITFVPPTWAVGYQIMRTNCLNIDYFLFGAVNSFQPLIDDTATFGDNLEVPESLRNRIQQHLEDARLVTGQDYLKFNETLANKPFFQSLASDVRRTTVAAALADASRLYIDVNNWYNSSKRNSSGTQNNPLNKLFYNYRPGDRVRFLASTTASPTDPQKVIYDVPILEFTGRGLIIEKPINVVWLPGSVGTDASDYIIEVYTPKIATTADYLYYESGEWYPVLFPGTASRDLAKRDWTYGGTNVNITCTTHGDLKVFHRRPFSYGDCHGILKTFYYNIQTLPLNSISVSAYTSSMNQDSNKSYDYWEKGDGRAAAAYTDLPVVRFKTTQLRFGGKIVEESFVNQINRFRDQDQKIFPSEYGRIRAMVNTSNAQVESVGAILFTIGERECFSIYVNRTTLEDLNGQTSVALSEKVLGSYNTLLGSHGTLNPESVTLNDGRVYFWDAMKGYWIRYGRDGLTKISGYKMRNWFRELGALLRNTYQTAELPLVISEFDPFNEELVTFIDHSTLPATFRDYTIYKGALFSEEDKRWKSCHSYTPERFAKLGEQLYYFEDGSLFKTEASETRSTFSGVKYDVFIEPVFNEIPKNKKVFQTYSAVATHKWSVTRFLSEYRGATAKRLSSLTLEQVEVVEDVVQAPIKNDASTTGGLTEGERMRSKAIRVLMKLDPSVVAMSLLHYVECGWIDSPKNP